MSLKTNVNIKYNNDADKTHVENKFKNQIETIINIIINELCEIKKNGKTLKLNDIKDKIKVKYDDYESYCSKNDPSGCKQENVIFNDKRIKDIINQLENNNSFLRRCKLKKQLILYNYSNVFLPTIVPWNYIYTQRGGVYKLIDDKNIKDLEFGLGKRINADDNTVVPCKYVDFDDFLTQYKNSGNKPEEFENAYQVLKMLDKGLPSYDEATKVINLVLKFIKYYTLPLKTLKECDNISQKS